MSVHTLAFIILAVGLATQVTAQRTRQTGAMPAGNANDAEYQAQMANYWYEMANFWSNLGEWWSDMSERMRMTMMK